MPKTKKPKEQKKPSVKKEIKTLRKVLGSLDSSVEEKKRALTTLAHLGIKEANEVIADFAFSLNKKSARELFDWANLALEEGGYLASVPKNPSEEERMLKEAVHREYMDRFFELQAEIEGVEEDVARRKYEYEVAKRLKKKAEDVEEKERWDIEESVQHDLLIWEESRKERLEEELKTVVAMAGEMNTEIESLKPLVS